MERIIKTIRFRPKREYLENIVEQFETVTKKAMAEGSIDSYFTAILDEEILYVGIFNSKEDSVGITSKGIELIWKSFFNAEEKKMGVEVLYSRDNHPEREPLH